MMNGLQPYPAYKESGVPWLGEIPSHWEITRAKNLFNKVSRPFNSDDGVVTCFRDGMVTLRKNRRLQGFTESLKEIGYQGVKSGDLVIHAMDAFAGSIGVSDSNGKCSPVYIICTPVHDENPNYYSYLLREMSRSQWIAALSRGIRERSTDFKYDTFSSQLLPIPPSKEQVLISLFLDNLEKRVRHYTHAKRRLIALLNEQKQAIIHMAVTRGLDPSVPMKPSDIEWLGEIPEHWDIKPLKQVLSRLIDTEHKTAPAFDNGKYPVIRTSNIKKGRLVFKDIYYTDEKGYSAWTRRGTPLPGDILFTREAPAGEACIVPEGLDLCMGQRVVLLGVDSKKISSEFLLYNLYSGLPGEYIKIKSVGSTLPHFNMSDIATIPILVPPIAEQLHLVEKIGIETQTIEALVDQTNKEIDFIQEYRTRLITDVVTGKLDVRHLAASLPDLEDIPLDEPLEEEPEEEFTDEEE